MVTMDHMVTRRLTLLGALALPILATAVPAAAAPGRTTIVLSPHQDDEVVRLSHYTTIAADRGDRMILAQATDGAATYVGSRLGLTGQQTSDWRHREQASAWSWLTDGRGTIERLGEPDGAASSDRIYAGVREIVNANSDTQVEVYVATWHHDRATSVSADKHTDHVACVKAARRLGKEGVVVRYAVHPTATQKGYSYYARNLQQELRVQAAVDAYRVIGRRSTKNLDLVMGTANRATW